MSSGVLLCLSRTLSHLHDLAYYLPVSVEDSVLKFFEDMAPSEAKYEYTGNLFQTSWPTWADQIRLCMLRSNVCSNAYSNADLIIEQSNPPRLFSRLSFTH